VKRLILVPGGISACERRESTTLAFGLWLLGSGYCSPLVVKAETYSIDKGGGEAVGFLDRNDLPGAEATELDVVHTVGRRVWGSIKHVSSIQAIFIRELMVNPGGNKVFIHNLLTGESEFATSPFPMMGPFA